MIIKAKLNLTTSFPSSSIRANRFRSTAWPVTKSFQPVGVISTVVTVYLSLGRWSAMVFALFKEMLLSAEGPPAIMAILIIDVKDSNYLYLITTFYEPFQKCYRDYITPI